MDNKWIPLSQLLEPQEERFLGVAFVLPNGTNKNTKKKMCNIENMEKNLIDLLHTFFILLFPFNH